LVVAEEVTRGRAALAAVEAWEAADTAAVAVADSVEAAAAAAVAVAVAVAVAAVAEVVDK
jgi:hypothetical protein